MTWREESTKAKVLTDHNPSAVVQPAQKNNQHCESLQKGKDVQRRKQVRPLGKGRRWCSQTVADHLWETLAPWPSDHLFKIKRAREQEDIRKCSGLRGMRWHLAKPEAKFGTWWAMQPKLALDATHTRLAKASLPHFPEPKHYLGVSFSIHWNLSYLIVISVISSPCFFHLFHPFQPWNSEVQTRFAPGTAVYSALRLR